MRPGNPLESGGITTFWAERSRSCPHQGTGLYAGNPPTAAGAKARNGMQVQAGSEVALGGAWRKANVIEIVLTAKKKPDELPPEGSWHRVQSFIAA